MLGTPARRVAARGELVEADAELVQQRRRHRPLPRSDDVLDALARPERRVAIAQQVAFVDRSDRS